MFRSKKRDIIFTQFEHGKLAGHLAQHWGNTQFSQPNIPIVSFVSGITLHDFGYGMLDTHSIGNMSNKERRQTLTNMIHVQLPDPIADLIGKYHTLRLIRWLKNADLEQACLAKIDATLSQIDIPHEIFQRVDRITNLCDSIAFAFCFEKAAAGQVAVFKNFTEENLTPISYQIRGSHITVDPWPFSTDAIHSSIIAFHSNTYPHKLKPILVPFSVVRKTA